MSHVATRGPIRVLTVRIPSFWQNYIYIYRRAMALAGSPLGTGCSDFQKSESEFMTHSST
jgi:hypothetical protein